ncbi:hypothetical protein JCM10450v2_004056 [Rhodotorula kratochvilovae]
MSSDTASVISFSSSTPLTGASSSPKSSSLLNKLFKRSSPSSRPASPPKSSEEVFREIMALNARHGDPSVQAYSVKTSSRSTRKSPSPPAKRAPSSPQSSQDIFNEVMRLNARHGDPTVQAYSVR